MADERVSPICHWIRAKIQTKDEQNETDCCLRKCDAVFMRKCDCAPAWSIGARPIE